MLENRTELKVRYAETDKMGVVYHANYIIYYEVGRTELFRQMGFAYTKLEELGVMMPVVEVHSKYSRPAHYDDTLTIVTQLQQKPDVRMRFDYTILNQKGEVLNTGYTVLVFVDMKTNRPIRMPKYLESFFNFDKKNE